MGLSIIGHVIKLRGRQSDVADAGAHEITKRRHTIRRVAISRRKSAADHENKAFATADGLVIADEEERIAGSPHARGEIRGVVVVAGALRVSVVAQRFIGRFSQRRELAQ